MYEVTVTGEYKPYKWLLSRVEFRNDWPDKPVFEKGTNFSKNQPTILLGIVASFSK